MLRRHALLIALVSAGLTFTACKKDTRPHSADWTDPAHDVRPFPQEPSWVQPDIIRAHSHGKEDFIYLTLEMPFSIEDYYNQHTKEGLRRGQLVGVFYIDTDNDTATGHAPMQNASRPGYEFAVRVTLGFWAKSKDTGLIRAGTVTFDPRTFVYKRTPSFELKKLHSDYLETVHPSIHVGVKSFADLVSTQGGQISVRLPYKIIGVKKKAAIRIAFHEASAGLHPEAYSTDQTFVLD